MARLSIIDTNGADWNWFIDSTPLDDCEFVQAGDQCEKDRMDLLTVVSHELGHVLGLEHDNQSSLQSSLEVCVRNMAAMSYVDLKPLAMALPSWISNHTQNKLHADHLAGIMGDSKNCLNEGLIINWLKIKSKLRYLI